jgi:hypothetical protein
MQHRSLVRRLWKSLRVKRNLLKQFKLIWVVQSPLAKIFRLTRRANHVYELALFRPERGALAIVTDVGMGCGGRDSVGA